MKKITGFMVSVICFVMTFVTSALFVAAYEGDIEVDEETKAQYEETSSWIDLTRAIQLDIPEGLNNAELFDFLMTSLGFHKDDDGEWRGDEPDVYELLHISADDSAVNKIIAAHNYLCDHHTYGAQEKNVQGLLKIYVCQEYANDFYELMRLMGIECDVVSGLVNDGAAHAWNRVLLGDTYYYTDVTWDDCYNVHWTEQNIWDAPYFMISYDEMSRNHIACEAKKPW